METRSTNALFKRAEQLKRWEESETNKECGVLKDKPRKINFTDECVFLAACSAGDKDEVKRLLLKGAYIDTANVDGLTALHQSCIDDNLDMVEFLVEHGADVNCGDNEGWTPLHATASCGFVSIAKYLIENGANVIAVNNDGELPLDIAEQDEMEELLQDELDKLGVDCDYARNIEEQMMLEDANRMLNGSIRIDERHPKTGATALHVGAAKNYIKVLRILLQAGLDINIQDFDGWTPLHAAAHWGQKDSCKILIENLCDMKIENYAGQTAFDVADPEMISFLEDLKTKQMALTEDMQRKAEVESIIQTRVFPSRVMANKATVPEKTNNINKDQVWERVQNDISDVNIQEKESLNSRGGDDSSESTESSSSSDDSEIEKRNDVNKVTSAIEVNTTKIVGPEQLRNKLPATKSVNRENDIVATIELPKVVRKEELLKPAEENIAEVVIKTVPSVVTPPSLAINISREPSTTTTSSATLSSASVPSTPTSANSQVRRSFVPPVRDEESETQRKAHAKRVRETRRSTQGVTLEDLKGAEQLVQKKNNESDEKPNAVEGNEEDNRVSSKVETCQDRENTTIERRPSWRIRVGRDEIKPVADSQNSRWSSESQEEPCVTAIVTLNNPANVENSGIPTRRARIPSSNISATPDVDTTVTVTLKSQSPLIQNDEDYSKDNDKDNDKENENKSLSTQATQAAIQRRRRPKRRSTGVVQIDLEDGENEKMDGNVNRDENTEPAEIIEDQAIGDKGYRSSRYGSTSSLSDIGSRGEAPSKASSRSSRAGSVGSAVSANENSELDYEKLYKEQKVENERLAEKQKAMEKDLEATKLQLDKAMTANQRNATSDADRREKRALERKLSEMEEELKQFDQLKVENQRLRDENGALIRVISKLSK